MPSYLFNPDLRLLSPGGDILTYIFMRTEQIIQWQVQDPFLLSDTRIEIGINIPNGSISCRVEVWANSARAMQACDCWEKKEILNVVICACMRLELNERLELHCLCSDRAYILRSRFLTLIHC